MAQVDPSGLKVYGVGQRMFAYWNCGLESRWQHAYLCLLMLSIVRWSSLSLAVWLTTRPKKSYLVFFGWAWSWSLDNWEALGHLGLLQYGKEIRPVPFISDSSGFLPERRNIKMHSSTWHCSVQCEGHFSSKRQNVLKGEDVLEIAIINEPRK
jgi:hypothetical protein